MSDDDVRPRRDPEPPPEPESDPETDLPPEPPPGPRSSLYELWLGLSAVIIVAAVVALATDAPLWQTLVLIAASVVASLLPVVLDRRRRSGYVTVRGWRLTAPVALMVAAAVVVAVATFRHLNGASPDPQRTAAVLKSTLLTAEDLPRGWDFARPADITGGPTGIAAQDICGSTVDPGPHAEESTALKAADKFLADEPVIFSVVADFPAGGAQKFMNATRAQAGCGSWVPGPGLTYTASTVNVRADEGTDVVAVELSASGPEAGPQRAHLVFLRRDDVVSLVVHQSPGAVDVGVTQLAVDAAQRRLRRVTD